MIEALYAAIHALPTPVDKDAILSTAKPMLDETEYFQFTEWMKTSGDALVNKLNTWENRNG